MQTRVWPTFKYLTCIKGEELPETLSLELIKKEEKRLNLERNKKLIEKGLLEKMKELGSGNAQTGILSGFDALFKKKEDQPESNP